MASAAHLDDYTPAQGASSEETITSPVVNRRRARQRPTITVGTQGPDGSTVATLSNCMGICCNAQYLHTVHFGYDLHIIETPDDIDTVDVSIVDQGEGLPPVAIARQEGVKVELTQVTRTVRRERRDTNVAITPTPGVNQPAAAAASDDADSVKRIDRKGRTVMKGDGVKVEQRFVAVYIGAGYMVRRDNNTGTIVKEKLSGTREFLKCAIGRRGNCRLYPGKQRLVRAHSKLGQNEAGDDVDFLYWCYTGLNKREAQNKNFTIGC